MERERGEKGNLKKSSFLVMIWIDLSESECFFFFVCFKLEVNFTAHVLLMTKGDSWGRGVMDYYYMIIFSFL